MFKTINECLDFVQSRRNSSNELAILNSLLDEIGHKDDDLKIIHVAGTNGKGSTVNYVMSILKSLGFKVGTMQSPHLLTHLDRIRINNNNIDSDYFLDKVNELLPLIDKYNLSMFSIDYLVAIDYFLDNKVDFVIIEVGIGGRLDTTNVIRKPRVSVITSIGYDHTNVLGNTLEEITFEKAGIIKKDSNTVISRLDSNLIDIVAKKCKLENNKLTIVNDYQKLKQCKFSYEDKEYEIKSQALYQFDNATLAIEVVKVLSQIEGFNFDYQLVKEGLKNAFWEGRFQIINNDPKVIIDGAHNTHGVKALCESLKEIDGPINLVFSALKDKNYQEMLDMFDEVVDHITITTFDNYRLFDTKTISLTSKMEIVENYIDAIESNIKKRETLIISGSLYFVSAVLEALEKGIINVSR